MSSITGPEFPPLLTGHIVFPPNQTLSSARQAIHTGSPEPGNLFWLDSDRNVDFTLYLEPEVSFEKSAQMLSVGMVAFGEAMGAIAPPEFGIQFGWPDVIYANKAKLGKVELFTHDNLSPEDVPQWMLLHLQVALKYTQDYIEPGDQPDVTTLSEEGCGYLCSTEIIESVSRHLLTWIHIWEEDGFRPVHQAWMSNALNVNQKVTYIDREQANQDVPSHDAASRDLVSKGVFLGLDETGGQLIKTTKDTIGLPLYKAVKILAFEHDR